MINELVRIHHENYLADIPFWRSVIKDKELVLELGCGHGRVTLPLSGSECQVFGLDLDFVSLQYLSNLFQSGEKGKPALIQADMLDLPCRANFGAVLIPCNTYSIFNSGQRIMLLRKIVQVLEQSGVFAFSVPNPVLIHEYHQELSVADEDPEFEFETKFTHPVSGNSVQVSSLLSPLANSLSWEWIYDHLYPDGKVERYKQAAIHQLCSIDQYRLEIESAGFQINSCLGNFDGTPYQNDSPYLIMVCSIS